MPLSKTEVLPPRLLPGAQTSVAQLVARRPTLFAVIALGMALAIFVALKYVVGAYPSAGAWIMGAAAVFAFAGGFWNHADLSPALSTFIRAFAAILAVYLLVEPFELPMTEGLLGDNPSIAFLYQNGRYLAVAAAVIAWYRPSFTLIPAVMVWELRRLNPLVTGFDFSVLDVENVVEVIVFLVIGTFLVELARRLALRVAQFEPGLRIDTIRANVTFAAMAMLFVAIGAHLGNYFYSFVAKLSLDGGPFTWVLDNQTYLGVPIGMERGAFPLTNWPELSQATYDILKASVLPMNVFVFIAQAAALFAFSRRRVLIGLTLLYDVFHLGVYLCFGLLFYKWIALNTIIVIVFSRMRDESFAPGLRFFGAIAVIAGTLVFDTARLAWYDSPGFLSPYFEAHTSDGKTYRVPPAYFRSASYQASHSRFYVPKGNEHFPVTKWGSFLNYSDLLSARRCEVPKRAQTNDERFGPIERVGDYMRAQHRAILEGADANGVYNYYRYPHHHVPSPGLADPFYAVDKRRVISYSYVLESVCVSLENGHLQRKVLSRTEYPIGLPTTVHAQQ